MSDTPRYRAKGFNHGAFVVIYEGDKPPKRRLLLACAELAYPMYKYSISEGYMLHNYNEWHRYGTSEYMLGAMFIKRRKRHGQ